MFFFRNCLVGRRYEVKVSDLGSYRHMYSTDYCQIAGSRPLPLRWMAWESVLLVSYTYVIIIETYNVASN